MSSGPSRFLLYIDILGFKEMTLSQPRKVARLYSILNTLNVHQHPNFKTIVFSDTVLVYNPDEVHNDDDRKYLVWYLTEFAEDLHSRLTGQDIWFRAVLLAGDFNHYRLENVECFYGEALITAYLAEKQLPVIGLVMHKNCLEFNRYFQTAEFSKDYHFIYLSRQLDHLHEWAQEKYPVPMWEISDQAPDLPEQVRFLSDLYQLMRRAPDPAVRAKALTTWDFYNRRYPAMLSALMAKEFDLSAVGPVGAWKNEAAVLEQNIKYFKRIGSGTPLSLSLSKRRRGRASSSR